MGTRLGHKGPEQLLKPMLLLLHVILDRWLTRVLPLLFLGKTHGNIIPNYVSGMFEANWKDRRGSERFTGSLPQTPSILGNFMALTCVDD